MIGELFKIKYNPNTSQPNTAALILCLKNKVEDLDLFKHWFSKELPTSYPNSEAIIQERIACAIRCRKHLDRNFGDEDLDGRALCIKYLERLISAKYSGKSQSYLSKYVEELGSIDLTLERLCVAIKHKKPLIFLFCFGGYKNYRSPTYPEVDWAEFFQLKFFIEYLMPIITDYKYGTLIQYESEDIIIERNYVPREALDKYAISFSKLLVFMKKLVKRQYNIDLNIELVRCRDQYDNSKLFDLMKCHEERILSAFEKLTDDEKAKWLQRAEANIMWENVIGYDALTDDEKKCIIKKARIDNECFLAADYELRGIDWEQNGGVDFFDRVNCIPFVGTWGYMPSDSPTDLWFHLKSSSTSSVDFWIGTGVLSFNNGVYKERIISPSQYRSIECQLKCEAISDPELLNISANFSTVKIFYGLFPY